MKEQAIDRYFKEGLMIDYNRHWRFLKEKRNVKVNNIVFTFIDYNHLIIEDTNTRFIIYNKKDLAHLKKHILLNFREALDMMIKEKQEIKNNEDAKILDKLAKIPNILEIVAALDKLENVKINDKTIRELKKRLQKPLIW